MTARLATPSRPSGAVRRPRGRAALTLGLGAGLLCGLPGVATAVVTPTPRVALPAGVESLQPYVGQEGCDPVSKPGVLAFQSLLMSTYRDTGSLGIVRDCGIGGTSEHKEGRAFDWAVSVNNANHVAEVTTLTNWLTAPSGAFASNARRFGIMYMIWNRQIWKAYQPESGWQPYTGPNPHVDHVHFSFGWNGAKADTSWWTGRVAALDWGPYNTSHPPAPQDPGGGGGGGPVTGPDSLIDRKHDELGGDGSFLGPATGPEIDVPGGRYRPYANGAIYWSGVTGAHELHGDIQRRYLAFGGSRSSLGLPTSDESAARGGRVSTFQGGMITWSSATGARALYGDIADRYQALGGTLGRLGLPVGEEGAVPGGRAVPFQNGRVLWSGQTGAHEVWGEVLEKYEALGSESGLLQLPLTGEAVIGTGRVAGFQGGDVYWSPTTGVHETHGAIRAKWLQAGGPNSWGLPTSDEVAEPGGRSASFRLCRVYWSAATGAHTVYGAIGQRFLAEGGVARFGMPLTDELPTPAGRTQDFQRATVDFDRATGTVSVRLR